jgi:hypothetical protein
MTSINIPETRIPIDERTKVRTGQKIKFYLEIEVLVDEPTWSGYNGVVCSSKPAGEQTSFSIQ